MSERNFLSERNFSLSTVPAGPMASVPKSVVFCDFDGPIVDVSERYYQTYRTGLLAMEQHQRQLREACLNFTLQPFSKAKFWQLKQNRVADLEISLRSGLPVELFKPFMQQVERIVNHPSLLRLDCVQPNALSALNYFNQCNIRVLLVTLRHPRQVQEFLQAQGLAHLVAEVYGALDVNAAQANRIEQKRALLTRAVAQQKALGYSTQGSWMIGDTEADVLAAQALGLSTAALSCGVRSRAYLQQLEPSQIYDCLMTAAVELCKTALLRAA
jgi:phosphoglycolate phosphatase